MEANRLPFFIRLFGKWFHSSHVVEVWPDRDWCCSSCADAYLLGRLAEAARTRERLKVPAPGY